MKEIKKLYAFTFFRSFTVFASISIAFYNSNGLSYFQIMLLQSLYAIVTALMEIPSGMLSDMLGRKKTLIIGTVSFFTAYLCGALGTGVLEFGLMQILAAVGQSCYSGTFLALMYEDINADKSMDKKANVIFANMQMINLVSALMASLVSVYVVKYISMRATYVVTTFMYAITFVISLVLHEKKGEKATKGDYSLQKYISIFKESILVIAKSDFVMLFVDMIIFACFANTVLYLQQPMLIDRNLPVAYFGVVTVVITVTTTLALKTVGYIEKKIKSIDKFLKKTTVFVIAMLCSNILVKNAIWVILTFVVLTIVVRIREIFIMTHINAEIKDNIRATVMSIISGIEMVGLAVLGAVIGYCEDVSINFSIIVVSVLMVICYSILWIMQWKKQCL